MKFDASWLAVSPPGPVPQWTYIGILVRGGDALSFHPVRGFEGPGAPLVRACENATAGETVDDSWDYFLERGIGGLSSFAEPVKIEADDRAAAVVELMRTAPDTGRVTG